MKYIFATTAAAALALGLSVGALASPIVPGESTSIFSATPTLPGSPFVITAAPGSSIPADNTPFVGNIFGGAGFALSGVENFDGRLASGGKMSALRFEIFEPTSIAESEGCNTTCVESAFTLELLDAGVSLISLPFVPTPNMINGVEVAEGFFVFDTFRVRETVGGDDNEFFANFSAMVLPTTQAHVPVPASGLLLLAGAGLLSLVRRRRSCP